MKETLQRSLRRGRDTFGGFSTGQKVITVIGTLALALGGFLVFRWASTPDYAPLYSDLSAADASAVVEQLESDGVPYELADGGATVLVPRDDVYSSRIALSGAGLPAAADGEGYSILDDQGMALSQDAQDVNFKRAMEGELAATIEAIDGVETAVVHLALPEKEVFADERDPATASVLVSTRPGVTLDPEQVQAVVNLVASSVDGLDPDNVTVADATGNVLSAPGGEGGDGGARNQMVSEVQDEYRGKLQRMLDRVLGPGNSSVQVTAQLDFDDSVVETTDYTSDPDAGPISSSRTEETYTGAGGAGAPTGVVGPDGEMDPAGDGADGGDSTYSNESVTEDNAVDQRTERRVSAPGSLESLHVGVAVDSGRTGSSITPGALRELVVATAGIDAQRGDTVSISSMTFNRAAEEAAQEQLAAAEKATAAQARNEFLRNVGLATAIGLAILVAAIMARRRAKRREEATNYLVDQLRQDQERLTATQVVDLPPASLALQQSEAARTDGLRREIDELIERQPDDVAALLRGWLAERR